MIFQLYLWYLHLEDLFGMRRLFKKKSDVTLSVLPPVYPSKEIQDQRKQMEELKQRVKQLMEDTVISKRNRR